MPIQVLPLHQLHPYFRFVASFNCTYRLNGPTYPQSEVPMYLSNEAINIDKSFVKLTFRLRESLGKSAVASVRVQDLFRTRLRLIPEFMTLRLRLTKIATKILHLSPVYFHFFHEVEDFEYVFLFTTLSLF